MAILSGVVSEDGEGFILLGPEPRIRVRSTVRPEDLTVGARVLVQAELRGVEWIADHVQVEG